MHLKDKSIVDHYALYSLILAAICLLVGIGIYALAREHILFLECIGWQGVYYTSKSRLMDWVVYNLPDGLWYVALLLLLDVMGRHSQSNRVGRITSTLMMTIAMLLPFVLEYAQKYGAVAGTFDYADILTYCITLILFIVLCKTKLLSLLRCKQVA